ncbi:SH3 domain-containing protein [Clostridium senegalense]
MTTDVLNVRNTPNGSIAGQVYKGEVYKINKKQNNWFEIFWGNYGGWVSENYVKTEFGKENNKREVYDMKKIVLYTGDLDALSAVIVAQKNQCPMMKKSDFINSKLKAEKIITIDRKTRHNRYTNFKDAASLV